MINKIKECIKNIWPFLATIALLVAMLMFGGCKSVKSVPIMHDTVYKTKTEYKDRYIHDSVWMDRYHEVYTKGDTVYIHDSVWNGQWKVKSDSVYIFDTIYRYKDNPVEVEKVKYKIPIWSWMLLGVFILLIIALVTYVAQLENRVSNKSLFTHQKRIKWHSSSVKLQ